MWIETATGPTAPGTSARQFIRQQWRMWIETTTTGPDLSGIVNSFASNGECGLKQAILSLDAALAANSFASNGECGLKLQLIFWHCQQRLNSFASNGECGLKPPSQKWPVVTRQNSFASNGECGLKLGLQVKRQAPAVKFIRQQWRMWIETGQPRLSFGRCARNSFASNGECGLKRQSRREGCHVNHNSFASNGECGSKRHRVCAVPHAFRNSFASNGECGLKPFRPPGCRFAVQRIHSPAMANVD